MTGVAEAEGALTEKLGPLSVWQWAGLASAGVLGYRWWHGRHAAAAGTASAASAEAAAAAAGAPPTGRSLAPGEGLYVPPVYSPPQPPIGAQVSPTTPQDNDAWRLVATRDLLASGRSPILIDQALSKYLGGDVLTPQEAAIVELAIAKDGPTPIAVPAPRVDQPQPAPAPAPAPAAPAPAPPPPAPVAPQPPPAPPPYPGAGQYMGQQDYLDSAEYNWAEFSQPNGWLDRFFHAPEDPPSHYGIIGGDGRPASKGSVADDLRAIHHRDLSRWGR